MELLLRLKERELDPLLLLLLPSEREMEPLFPRLELPPLNERVEGPLPPPPLKLGRDDGLKLRLLLPPPEEPIDERPLPPPPPLNERIELPPPPPPRLKLREELPPPPPPPLKEREPPPLDRDDDPPPPPRPPPPPPPPPRPPRSASARLAVVNAATIATNNGVLKKRKAYMFSPASTRREVSVPTAFSPEGFCVQSFGANKLYSFRCKMVMRMHRRFESAKRFTSTNKRGGLLIEAGRFVDRQLFAARDSLGGEKCNECAEGRERGRVNENAAIFGNIGEVGGFLTTAGV